MLKFGPRKSLLQDFAREISITTLDSLVDEHRFQGPFGIKIDAEGCGAAIIEGATTTLQTTEFVIAEVAVAQRFYGGYTFAEFISLMDGHNFELCDLLDIGRAANSDVTFIDGVFRRKVDAAAESSPLRGSGLTEQAPDQKQ